MTTIVKEQQLPRNESSHDNRSVATDIVGDASFYILCTYIFQLTAFGVGMVTKRFLGPEGAGTWSFFLMVLSYCALQHFGIIDGSEKQIAFYRGMNRHDYSSKIKNNMFGLVGIISIISSILILSFVYFAGDYISSHLSWALLHVGLIIPVFMGINYVTVSMRATKRFKLLGSTLIAIGMLNISVGIFLVWKWQLEGMYAAFCLINVVNLIAWFLITRNDTVLRFKFTWDKAVTKEVLRVGFPIALLGLVWTLLRTVDSLVVVSSNGTEALGYYALGVSINGFIFHTPNALSIVMFPRFQEKFGESSDINSLKDYVIKPIIALSFFALPLLIGSAYFFVPILIKNILPKFIPGIYPLKILLGGTFWISMVLMPFHFLITINKQTRAVFFGIIGTSMSYAGAKLAASSGWGLPGIAACVAISYMLFFLIFINYIIRYSKWDFKPIRFTGQITSGFIWIVIVAVGCDYLIGFGSALASQILLGALKFTIFVIAIVPLLIIAERQTGVIGRCKEQLLIKLKG